jgi:hypothetical protein
LAKFELVLNTFDDLAASKTLHIITQRGSGISHLNLEKSELSKFNIFGKEERFNSRQILLLSS